jgi:hypothetical protein
MTMSAKNLLKGQQRFAANEERPTSRHVTVCGIDEPKGPRETKLGRGICSIRGGEDSMNDISIEATLDDAERVVILVVDEKDR